MPPTDPACGTTWRQAGNNTGHCGGRRGCHRTFDSEQAFDRHQTVRKGVVVCRDPATLYDLSDSQAVYESRVGDDGVTYWRMAVKRPLELAVAA